MEINKSNLSIIILAGNEEKTIIDCLKSCSWAKEIILVAANSTDNTITLARKTIPTIKKTIVKILWSDGELQSSLTCNLVKCESCDITE